MVAICVSRLGNQLSCFHPAHDPPGTVRIRSMSKRLTCEAPSSIYHPLSSLPRHARVVKWQTRTFEGRMPQGMGVQVPPRALFHPAPDHDLAPDLFLR